MRVIGVVGFPASGKGEVAAIAKDLGIPVVVMGDVIRDAVREEGLPPTDENLGAVANRIRREEGMDAVARRCIPLIESQKSDIVLVDGIRGDSEVQVFRSHFPDFILIGIQSSPGERLARMSSRGRSDDLKERQDLRHRDERELNWGLGRALAGADIVIPNEGSLESFRAEVRNLFSRFLGVE